MPTNLMEKFWVVRVLGKQRYLLIAMLALLVLLPVLKAEETSRFWISALLTVIVIAGPLSIATKRVDLVLAAVFGLTMATSSWGRYFFDGLWLERLGGFATVSFFLLLSILIFRQYLLGNKKVTSETLIAAINAYICIGIMYAFAYDYALMADPNAFSGTFIANHSFEDCVYLSFVTLTTLGYGDITPMSRLAAVLTWTEALAGQLFIALTIARIVGVMASKEES